VPYEGLGERRFKLRNSLLKSGEPCFVLRIVQLEAQEEEIANEFRDLLVGKFDGKPVERHLSVASKPNCAALIAPVVGLLVKRNPFIYRHTGEGFVHPETGAGAAAKYGE
jgi:hypothetical protein